MTDDERAKILQMIEDGKISAQQGLELMNALRQDDEAGEEFPADEPEPGYGSYTPEPPDPEVESLKSTVRALYAIPLFLGVLLTVGMAWLMYQGVLASEMGFVFYCIWLPLFLFGVLLVSISAAGRTSRWMYADIRPKKGDGPRRIMIGFPLQIVTWVLGTFSSMIPSDAREKAEMMMNAINETTADAPVVVSVDEGKDGDRVKLYIG